MPSLKNWGGRLKSLLWAQLSLHTCNGSFFAEGDKMNINTQLFIIYYSLSVNVCVCLGGFRFLSFSSYL